MIYDIILSDKYHSILTSKKENIVYLDCKVEIPNEPGKITRFKKGKTVYIRYVVSRTYHPDKKYNVPDHKTIGKLDPENPAQMIPNENKEKNGASRRICSPDATSPVFGHRIRRKIKRTGRYY